ncbi:hypothetical protein TPHA_0E01250 [Tetrapisispora phaffii CBS 4417]|uniref:Small ribosomal subunit protein mS41 n=1 Tax=Tetrapisispora phaffii (strain ATCC 24235 / CBS 4417 / NBRC 1672 / NRRL Y-8282 / UCD 70-5) TaxID=1071381 RepID=G8BTJ2_TETPH|nr:hypothetical protein TPHA_0E01250 [Tetrapisispora phaffii CBS 4417]CCE63220.1 hypothetical protein TPHA_0E01250 [Tetrapisispora phaffii CBS 4417]
MSSRRFFSIGTPILNSIKVAQMVSLKPTQSIPDVKTFLTIIGRGCHELADTYENNWENLVSWDSRMLKEKGVSVQQRKYILVTVRENEEWSRDKRNKKGKKSFFGGERHRKENIAKYQAEQRNK